MQNLKSLLMSLIFIILLSSPFINSMAVACPFCGPSQRTLGEEIDSSDVVLIAELVQIAVQDEAIPDDDLKQPTDLKKSKFKLIKVIRGQKHLGKRETFEYLYFGDAKKGSKFLIMGIQPPKTVWSSPISLNTHGAAYLEKVVKLPKKGPQRLVFFQDYLEHQDEMLARDAYDEFAKAPYASILKLKTKLKHDHLIKWIKDTDIPTSRRRLYLTLLGICGTKKDIPLLEKMITSKKRKTTGALDATVACYLSLRGAKGLDLIDEQIFKNKKADYSEIYSTMMAIRFHGTELQGLIPKERLLKTVRLLLDRPDVADLIIPDLARWEDWSVVNRLVKLFKDSDPKVSWVRIPIINFLKVCPKKEAKQAMVKLEKFDPESFKRAKAFFDYGPSDEKESPKNKKEKSKVPSVPKVPAPSSN